MFKVASMKGTYLNNQLVINYLKDCVQFEKYCDLDRRVIRKSNKQTLEHKDKKQLKGI